MKKIENLRALSRSAAVIATIIIVTGGLAATLWAADSTADPNPDAAAKNPPANSAPKPTASEPKKTAVKPEPAKPDSTAQKPKPASRQISGAEVYSMHCFRCHPERYPGERTSAQWKTIVLHMRVRANLSARDANLVLKYLQDNSGY